MIEENMRKATWKSKISKNRVKDKDDMYSNFLVMFPARPKELLRGEKGQLTDVGHNLY